MFIGFFDAFTQNLAQGVIHAAGGHESKGHTTARLETVFELITNGDRRAFHGGSICHLPAVVWRSLFMTHHEDGCHVE